MHKIWLIGGAECFFITTHIAARQKDSFERHKDFMMLPGDEVMQTHAWVCKGDINALIGGKN